MRSLHAMTRRFAMIAVAFAIAWITTPGLRADEPIAVAGAEDASAASRYSRPPAKTVVPADGTNLPMQRWGGRPVLAVSINGSTPYRFILDTGSSLTAIVDRQVAAAIGLEGGEPLDLARMKGEGVTLDEIRVGTTVLTGIPTFVNDIGKFLPGPDAPAGVLGIGLFADCLLTYDFPEECYRIESGSLPEPGGDTVAYTYDGGIRIDIDVAGHTVPVHLDTGAPATLLVTNGWESKLPLTGAAIDAGQVRTPMGGASMRQATLDGSVRFAGHEFANPTVRFADLPQIVAKQMGNIGTAFLGEFALTLDQQNRRVRFAKP